MNKRREHLQKCYLFSPHYGTFYNQIIFKLCVRINDLYTILMQKEKNPSMSKCLQISGRKKNFKNTDKPGSLRKGELQRTTRSLSLASCISCRDKDDISDSTYYQEESHLTAAELFYSVHT